jgi:hypothetical protein
MGWDLLGKVTPAQLVDEMVELLWTHAITEPVVDLKCRRLGACSDALDVFEGEHPIGGGTPCLHPEPIFCVLEELPCPE